MTQRHTRPSRALTDTTTTRKNKPSMGLDFHPLPWFNATQPSTADLLLSVTTSLKPNSLPLTNSSRFCSVFVLGRLLLVRTAHYGRLFLRLRILSHYSLRGRLTWHIAACCATVLRPNPTAVEPTSATGTSMVSILTSQIKLVPGQCVGQIASWSYYDSQTRPWSTGLPFNLWSGNTKRFPSYAKKIIKRIKKKTREIKHDYSGAWARHRIHTPARGYGAPLPVVTL